MHPSSSFRMPQDEALAFAAQSGIGHLTTYVDGRIESVLIPFFVDDRQDPPTIYGHVSVLNPQTVSINDRAEALLIVDGPVSYVSPGLYTTKAETGRVVPTLSYLSVHVRGRLAPVTSTDDFRELLAVLTSRFETGRDEPWSIDDAPSGFVDAQMRAIQGFSLRVDDIQGVAKHSQNRPESDRVSVRTAFADGTDEQVQIAGWMTS